MRRLAGPVYLFRLELFDRLELFRLELFRPPELFRPLELPPRREAFRPLELRLLPEVFRRLVLRPPLEVLRRLVPRAPPELFRRLELRLPVLVLRLVGSFLRLVPAISSRSSSLIDSYIPREAPCSSDSLSSPRLALRAAPAAICCFFEVAFGMGLLSRVWGAVDVIGRASSSAPPSVKDERRRALCHRRLSRKPTRVPAADLQLDTMEDRW